MPIYNVVNAILLYGFLSKKRKYGSTSPYVLVVLDQLSRYLFLEIPSSLKFVHQQAAWKRIFERLKTVYPAAIVSVVCSDNGPEFGFSLKSWFQSMDIKMNKVKLRPYRLSRGSPYAEAAIRRIRFNLEKQMKNKKKTQSFGDVLRIVENISNNQILSTLRMSATSALLHKPEYIAMLSESIRHKRKNYLGNGNKTVLPMYTVVRVKKFLEKEFSSSRKESYGFLSPCFLVMGTLKGRPIVSYKLANLFTLSRLPGSFTKHELVVTRLTYIEACEMEERNVLKVVKYKDDIVQYTINASDRLFVARKELIDS